MSGILIIAAIAVAVVILGFALHAAFDRFYLRRSRQPEIFRRSRRPRGRVGRIR